MTLGAFTTCGCGNFMHHGATCAHCGKIDNARFEPIDERAEPDFEREFEEAIANFEDELAADDGDSAAAIRLWMRGQPLPPVGRAIIDNLSHGNRLALLATIYASEAA